MARDNFFVQQAMRVGTDKIPMIQKTIPVRFVRFRCRCGAPIDGGSNEKLCRICLSGERIPCINDVVRVQGRPGARFRVTAVYVNVELVGLAPINGEEEMDFRKEDLAPWLTLVLLCPRWRYNLHHFVQRPSNILRIVVLVTLLWALIRFGVLPYLFLGFVLFMALVPIVRMYFARQKHTKRLRWQQDF